MDPISDVFTALEVQSVFYGRYEFGAPWGIRFPPGHASFGMVLRGQCWLQVEGSSELALDGGDCYVLPRGVAYSLLDDATSALVDIARHGTLGSAASQAVRLQDMRFHTAQMAAAYRRLITIHRSGPLVSRAA